MILAQNPKQLDPTTKLFSPQNTENVERSSNDINDNNSSKLKTQGEDINNEWIEINK